MQTDHFDVVIRVDDGCLEGPCEHGCGTHFASQPVSQLPVTAVDEQPSEAPGQNVVAVTQTG